MSVCVHRRRWAQWQWPSLKVDKLLGALFSARYSQGFLLVVVKVARVTGAFAFGQERRFNLRVRKERERKRVSEGQIVDEVE